MSPLLYVLIPLVHHLQQYLKSENYNIFIYSIKNAEHSIVMLLGR